MLSLLAPQGLRAEPPASRGMLLKEGVELAPCSRYWAEMGSSSAAGEAPLSSLSKSRARRAPAEPSSGPFAGDEAISRGRLSGHLLQPD